MALEWLSARRRLLAVLLCRRVPSAEITARLECIALAGKVNLAFCGLCGLFGQP